MTMHIDVSLQVELGGESFSARLTVVDGLGPAGVALLVRGVGHHGGDHVVVPDDGRPGVGQLLGWAAPGGDQLGRTDEAGGAGQEVGHPRQLLQLHPVHHKLVHLVHLRQAVHVAVAAAVAVETEEETHCGFILA